MAGSLIGVYTTLYFLTAIESPNLVPQSMAVVYKDFAKQPRGLTLATEMSTHRW